jgi:hypothetical protein
LIRSLEKGSVLLPSSAINSTESPHVSQNTTVGLLSLSKLSCGHPSGKKSGF